MTDVIRLKDFNLMILTDVIRLKDFNKVWCTAQNDMKQAVCTSLPADWYVDQPVLGGTLKYSLVWVSMGYVSADAVETCCVSADTGWNWSEFDWYRPRLGLLLTPMVKLTVGASFGLQILLYPPLLVTLMHSILTLSHTLTRD